MEIPTTDLESHFPQKNPTAIRNFNGATSRSKDIEALRLVSQYSKQFMGAGTREEEKIELQGIMDRQLLTDSRGSSSNQAEKICLTTTSRSKVCRNPHKELCERLRILEDEMDIMKQEFYEHAEERRKLVDEIFQQFQTIQSCLQLRNRLEEGTSDACFLSSHDDKVEGLTSGLSEVLHPNLSPRLVIRDQRTNILALLEVADTVILHSTNR